MCICSLDLLRNGDLFIRNWVRVRLVWFIGGVCGSLLLCEVYWDEHFFYLYVLCS